MRDERRLEETEQKENVRDSIKDAALEWIKINADCFEPNFKEFQMSFVKSSF